MKKSPVVHFEMPAKDLVRVKKFYEDAFGWGMNQMGADMGNYLLAGTVDVDEKTQMPKTPGAINGGFWVPDDNTPHQPPHVVISVDDLEEAIEMVKRAGGEVLDEPMEIPGIGRYVSIKDTEGNIVGVLQPAPMQ
jgi:uncharacterized protein